MDKKLKALRREYLKYVDQELPKVPAQRGPIERWDQWLSAIVFRSREENAKLVGICKMLLMMEYEDGHPGHGGGCECIYCQIAAFAGKE